MGALDGYRALCLQNMPPVASAGYLLAEMGMDVIEVEAPNPNHPIAAGGNEPDPRATAFNVMSRNKRSIALDLRSESGHSAFLGLAKSSDVIIEGFRPGAASRLGISYDAVKVVAPSIIYCSISGFGQTGPYADIPAHDTEACAAGGAVSQNVDSDGTPVVFGVFLADTSGGLHAVSSILAALLHREKSGVGQYLDVSMTASVMTFQLLAAGRALESGVTPRAWPLDLGVFKCADGRYVSAMNSGPHLWRNFCAAMELPQLVDVVPNGPQWQATLTTIRERFMMKSRDEWFVILHAAGASVAPVLEIAEVADDPQALHFGAMQDVEHPVLGTIRHPGFPVRFSLRPQPSFGSSRHIRVRTPRVCSRSSDFQHDPVTK